MRQQHRMRVLVAVPEAVVLVQVAVVKQVLVLAVLAQGSLLLLVVVVVLVLQRLELTVAAVLAQVLTLLGMELTLMQQHPLMSRPPGLLLTEVPQPEQRPP